MTLDPEHGGRGLVVDLFAGPGGWDCGARAVGVDPVGVELDAKACETRAAAGLRTIRADVAALPTGPFAGRTWGLIGSPPCPAFSQNGDRDGIAHLDALVAHVHACAEGWRPWDGDPNPLVWLVLEPLRWALGLRPEWIVLEQVPPVLPVWEAYCRTLAVHGWKCWAGVLNAADLGVPQTRRRAVLIASRVRQPWPPDPTHAREPGGLFALRPWISMAEALGWDRADLVLHTNRGQTEDGARQTVGVGRPAPSVTGKSGAQWVFDRPATTIAVAGAPADDGDEDDTAGGPDDWPFRRPATTVMGDTRIFRPDGHHPYQGKPHWSVDALRVELSELGVLQGFPADWPWRGNKSERAQQIGNAVPPPVAAAVIAAATGLAAPDPDEFRPRPGAA